MSSSKELVNLAKSLPGQLQRFFARYPPAAIQAPTADGSEAPKTAYQLERPNPFRFWKHPGTGKWHDPVYSMRRQAELVKMAKANGVEDLLPETTKGSEYRLARRVEFGLRVKGTGVGQKVKGHAHERQIMAKYVSALYLVFGVAFPEWIANIVGAGCRRGERPCWRCPSSSRSGRGYVPLFFPSYSSRHDVNDTTDWKAQLDQVPQIIGTLIWHVGCGPCIIR